MPNSGQRRALGRRLIAALHTESTGHTVPCADRIGALRLLVGDLLSGTPDEDRAETPLLHEGVKLNVVITACLRIFCFGTCLL